MKGVRGISQRGGGGTSSVPVYRGQRNDLNELNTTYSHDNYSLTLGMHAQ